MDAVAAGRHQRQSEQARAESGHARQQPGQQQEQALRQAFEEGVQEGRRQAQEALAAQAREMEQLRQQHAAELQRREEQWQQQQGQHLAQALLAGLRELEQVLGERLAEVLAPLLEKAARQQAMHQMGAMLRDMLARDGALQVRVTGPQPMLDALQEELGAVAGQVVMESRHDTCEVVAHVDNTVVETQVRAWARTVLPGPDDGEQAA